MLATYLGFKSLQPGYRQILEQLFRTFSPVVVFVCWFCFGFGFVRLIAINIILFNNSNSCSRPE